MLLNFRARIDEEFGDCLSFDQLIEMREKGEIRDNQVIDEPIILYPMKPGMWSSNGKDSFWAEDGRGEGSFIVTLGPPWDKLKGFFPQPGKFYKIWNCSLRYYQPKHSRSVSPFQLNLSSATKWRSIPFSEDEKQRVLNMTFRPEKISAGFVVDEFVDIDAKVTNARVKVDRWGESTVYLQAELVRQGSRVEIESRFAQKCVENPEERAKYLIGRRIRVPNARTLNESFQRDEILRVYKPLSGIYEDGQLQASMALQEEASEDEETSDGDEASGYDFSLSSLDKRLTKLRLG